MYTYILSVAVKNFRQCTAVHTHTARSSAAVRTAAAVNTQTTHKEQAFLSYLQRRLLFLCEAHRPPPPPKKTW